MWDDDRELLHGCMLAVGMGLRIFPVFGVVDGKCTCGDPRCRVPGKHPMVRWRNVATKDRAIIKRWCDRYPEMNVGACTGHGVVVIDCDPRHGGNASQLSLPPTLEALTGSGGSHHFFWGDSHNSAGVIAPGIDVRGEGGYVVIAPSLHVSGKSYSWVDSSHPMVKLPARFWRMKSPESRPPLTPAQQWGEGVRHSRMVCFARWLRGSGASVPAIEAMLLIENDVRCNPPLDHEEVVSIAKNMSRYPEGSIEIEQRKQEWRDIIHRLGILREHQV